ncbi:MAG TPA: hypothetical protein VJ964_07080 [Balneolaceae bacterium]|nr:hypothetical protein [Balneolaceae bacterium]
MVKRVLLLLILPAGVLLLGSISNTGVNQNSVNVPYHQLFQTSDACMSCHNGLITSAGEDVSIGTDWRTTMMANSSRDPYWHAAVRREVTDHPESRGHIEEECSTCHMPMSHYEAKYNGNKAKIFAHLPVNGAANRADLLAADGVSCTSCHQITREKLGSYESFVGRFVIDSLKPMGRREVFGPYPVDPGRSSIMHSSSGFLQAQSAHIQSSELCATCHTLITKSLGPNGEVIGELPEQVPYLEWRHSSFKDEQSCQSCHMPVIEEEIPISSVMGQPQKHVSRHTFLGGNFFMMKILNRYRNELGVQALPREMEDGILRTVEHLQSKAARIEIDTLQLVHDKLQVQLSIDNMSGHKLPTAYPSRRIWIHLTVQNKAGDTLFESGSLRPDGSIVGNDNDENAARYERHYSRIYSPDQVQIYESIMAGPGDEVTTGLLTAVRFIKDNRILPNGFDKSTADQDIAVQGNAGKDDDFAGGRDRITYLMDLGNITAPLFIKAELWYQPIGYRWAQNLSSYKSEEAKRFVSYYDSMSGESALKLADVTGVWR